MNLSDGELPTLPSNILCSRLFQFFTVLMRNICWWMQSIQEERGRTKQRTKRRKVRKAHQGDDDTSKNTGNNYITCEQLCGIEDDVVGVADCEQGIGKLAFVTMTSASVLQSQPVNKMFFETTSKLQSNLQHVCGERTH